MVKMSEEKEEVYAILMELEKHVRVIEMGCGIC